MYGAKKYMYIKPALKLLDGLALFPEEKLMLKTLIGETSSLKEMMQKHKKVIETSENEITNEYNVLINELRYDPHHYSKRNALEEKYWGDCRDFLARQQYAEAHQAYLNMVFDLFQRTEKRFAINSIVLSFLSLLKIRNSHDVLREFEKYIFQL